MKTLSDYYKVTCKCNECDHSQVVKISEIADGQTQCRMRRIGGPECPGKLSYYADDQETAVANAVSILGWLNAKDFYGGRRELAELIDQVVDDVELNSEKDQTPQQMGWVDSFGRP